jgi:ketosteroid isomerase-like protein
LLLILSLSAPVLAQATDIPKPTTEKKKSASETKAETEVVTALRARKETAKRHDIEAWAAFLAEDCVFTGGGQLQSKPDAVKENKAEWANAAPGVKHFEDPPEDIQVSVHGDTATAVFIFRETLEIGGQTTSSRSWQTDTFRRRGNKWLLVASGDAVLPPEPKVAKVDPSLYDA